MFIKIQIFWLVIFCGWFVSLKAQKVNPNSVSPKRIYLLTAQDRKSYALTVDERKINKVIRNNYRDKNRVYILIPVTVHNNSGDTLKYLSMNCSWQYYYHVDNSKFNVVMSSCDNNGPIEAVVPPYSSQSQALTIVYNKSSLKHVELFKIGLNVNRNVLLNATSGFRDQLRRYNIIWSNEVRFKSE